MESRRHQDSFYKTGCREQKDKTTKERYGAFAVEGEDYRLSHLWLLHFHYDSVVLAGQVPCYTVKKDSAITNDSLNKLRAADCVSLPAPRRLTEGAYTVTRFVWNPDGKTIAMVRQPDPLINSFLRADISLLNIATKKDTVVVNNPTGDFFSFWSQTSLPGTAPVPYRAGSWQ